MFTAIDCGSPPAVSYTNVDFTETLYNYLATYTCMDEYILYGQPTIICLANGQWTNPPKCVEFSQTTTSTLLSTSTTKPPANDLGSLVSNGKMFCYKNKNQHAAFGMLLLESVTTNINLYQKLVMNIVSDLYILLVWSYPHPESKYLSSQRSYYAAHNFSYVLADKDKQDKSNDTVKIVVSIVVVIIVSAVLSVVIIWILR